jgi:hypothetical protein
MIRAKEPEEIKTLQSD